MSAMTSMELILDAHVIDSKIIQNRWSCQTMQIRGIGTIRDLSNNALYTVFILWVVDSNL